MGVTEDERNQTSTSHLAQPLHHTPIPPHSHTLLFLSLAFFLTFLGAGAFQQYVKPLHEQLHLTSQQAAWVLSTIYLSFLVWRIFCAFTLYALGDYWSIFLGLLTYAAFTAVALISPSFPTLLTSAIVWGWGAAALWIASSTLILDATVKTRHGAASGYFYAATHAGQGLGVLLLGWLLGGSHASAVHHATPSAAGQMHLARALAIAALLSTLAAVAALKVPRHTTTREKPRLNRIFGVLTSAKSRMIAIALLVSSLGFGILLNGLGAEIKTRFGIAAVGIVTQGFYISRLVTSFFGGAISDRVGRTRVLLLGFLLAAIGLGAVALFPSYGSMLFAAATLGVQLGIVPVAAMAMIGDATTSERRHLVFGALYVWRDLGVVLAILGGEYIHAWFGSWQAAFALFAALFLLCAIVSGRLGKYSEEAL